MEKSPEFRIGEDDKWRLLDHVALKDYVDLFISREHVLLNTDGGPGYGRFTAETHFNDRLRRTILGEEIEVSDADFFIYIQIAIRQPQRLGKKDERGLDWGTTPWNAEDVIYEGVNQRVRGDQTFARSFRDFMPALGNFYNNNNFSAWQLSQTSRRWAIRAKAELDSIHATGQSTTDIPVLANWAKVKVLLDVQYDSFSSEKSEKGIKRSLKNKLVELAWDLDQPSRRAEYFFAPLIEAKETDILTIFSRQLDSTPANEYFGLKDDSGVLERMAAEIFRRLLREAGEAGWPNGAALFQAMERPHRGTMDGFSKIIHLSNLIVKTFDGSAESPFEDKKLTQMNPLELENVQEAIDRCMFVIFERGKLPDKDPTNYLLTADIVSKLFTSAIALEKLASSDSRDNETAARIEYRRTLGVNRNSRGYWNRWKSGYGIIS